MLLLAAAGCDRDPPPPWESASATAPPGPRLHVGGPTPATAPSASAAPASAASAAPRRARPPGAPPLCDEGLRASGEPRRDVVRLGLSCGAAEGFTRDLDAIEGALAEGGTPVEVAVPLAAGRCHRLVAAAETTVADLDVELRSERDIPLASDDDDAPLVVLHREGTVCPTAAGAARAIVRAGAGRGRFAAEVWSRPATASDHHDEPARAHDSPRSD